MSSSTDISTLYREFTDALTEVLPENAGGPAPPWPPCEKSGCRQEAPQVQ